MADESVRCAFRSTAGLLAGRPASVSRRGRLPATPGARLGEQAQVNAFALPNDGESIAQLSVHHPQWFKGPAIYIYDDIIDA
jgi:Zn-dependent protease with chaperone function